MLCLAAPLGCADRSASSLRLVVISPNRDEIREEVAIAFRSWFEARTQARRANATEQLQAHLTGAVDAATADKAIQEFLSDWSEADLGSLSGSYRAWHEQPTKGKAEALQAALKEWTGYQRPVEVVWQDIGGGTSAIARYVRSQFEASPDGIGIDLLFGGGTDIFLRFAEQGVLEPLDMSREIRGRIRSELNGVPLYDPKCRWFGPVLSSFGILTNKEVLKRLGNLETPSSWSDLGKPELCGWVASGDPRLTGSVHMVFEIILQGEGWDNGFRQLLRLGANTHSFVRDSGTLTRTVTSGEVASAGNVDVNALSAVGRDPQMMTFTLPQVEKRKLPGGKVVKSGGTIINPDAVAVLKGAPHKELARAFVEFTLSDAGQRLFLLLPGQPGGPRRYPLCRLSVVEALYEKYPPDVRSVGAANPFAATDVVPYNSERGNRRWDALNDVIGAVIVDAHPELSAAWRAVLNGKAENQAKLEEELFQPPCTEAELTDHARRIVQDGPRARAAQVNTWGEAARERYRRIRRQAEN